VLKLRRAADYGFKESVEGIGYFIGRSDDDLEESIQRFAFIPG
jgi:hypothetical protein